MSEEGAVATEEKAEAWTRLHSLVTEVSRALGSAARPLGRVLNGADDLSILTYRVAAMFVGEARMRQALLEESNPIVRAELLVKVLGGALLQLIESRGGDEEGPDSSLLN